MGQPTPRTGNTATSPACAGLVPTTLIVVAGVANLNPSVPNVGLPDIGKLFDSSQTTLDLIGYSVGLACSAFFFFPRHEEEERLLAEYHEAGSANAQAQPAARRPLAPVGDS